LIAAVIVRAVVTPAAPVKTLTLSGHGLVAAAVVELLFTFALAYGYLPGQFFLSRCRSRTVRR
jgi:ABC-type transport system involved in cytochrome bd biosynthesis fused ATPase/permease subunit